MTARELDQLLRQAGWVPVRQKGSHVIDKHHMCSGRIVVPMHSGDVPKGTLNRILKQAGINP